ncbi:PucR family transcriptional regulator, partial [Virgibacillus kimchii]
PIFKGVASFFVKKRFRTTKTQVFTKKLLTIRELEQERFYEKLIHVENKTYALMPVRVLGQVWGYLCLHISGDSPDEFVFHVLDRASLAIAQILLRNRTMEERKFNIEDELVQNLMLGKPYHTDELKFILPPNYTETRYYVFVSQSEIPAGTTEEEWEEIKLQRSMSTRALCKRSGLYPAVSVKKSEITVICFFHIDQPEMQVKQKMQKLNGDFSRMMNQELGISRIHKDISQAARAYQEAKEVLRFNRVNESKEIFYEKIGIHRLLFHVKDEHLLNAYIDDYIGPLLRYDREMKSQLLTTLELYLKFNESKKETAERLYIVRQTLYHRLEKIEDLLGEDYLEPTNRLAIEAAIKAYHLTKKAP